MCAAAPSLLSNIPRSHRPPRLPRLPGCRNSSPWMTTHSGASFSPCHRLSKDAALHRQLYNAVVTEPVAGPLPLSLALCSWATLALPLKPLPLCLGMAPAACTCRCCCSCQRACCYPSLPGSEGSHWYALPHQPRLPPSGGNTLGPARMSLLTRCLRSLAQITGPTLTCSACTPLARHWAGGRRPVVAWRSRAAPCTPHHPTGLAA